MNYRDEYRQASSDGRWLLPRVAAWVVALFGVALLIGSVMAIGTLGFGWFSGEANLRSFGHVRQTYAFAYDRIGALRSLQAQICTAKAAVAQAPDQATLIQRQTQLLAYTNTYNRTEQEYDAYMADHFRGGVIRPRDLPYPAPALSMRACK